MMTREFLTYALVGFLASIIYGLVLWGSTGLIGSNLGAVLIAQIAALAFHFVVNANVTFRSLKITRQILRRYVAYQLAINLALAGLSLFLLQLGLIHPLIIGIVSTGLIGVAGFLLAKFWVFA